MPELRFTRIEAKTMQDLRAKDILEMNPTYSFDLTYDEMNMPKGKRIKFFFQLSSKPEVFSARMEGDLIIEGSTADIDLFLAPARGAPPPATQMILSESLGVAISLAQSLGVPRPTLPLNLKGAMP